MYVRELIEEMRKKLFNQASNFEKMCDFFHIDSG